MLHLYYLLRDHLLFGLASCQKRVVQRSPKVKLLFIHDFGLTIGIVLIFVAMAFWRNQLGILTSLLVFLVFIVLTRYWAWLLLILCSLFTILFIFAGGQMSPNFFSSFRQISAWYMAGYISGFVFALCYDAFVFLSLKMVHCCRKNIFAAVFAYSEKASINIIKSPIKDQEVKIPPPPSYIKLYDDKKLEPGQMPHPYTIAFIANPFYKCRKDNSPDQFDVKVDPIIRHLDLFIQGIDRALFSFERDPVVGRPEIWSKVKILTFFPANFETEITGDSREKYTLAGRIKEDVEIDTTGVDDLFAIDENFDENFENVLKKLGGSEYYRKEINKKERTLIDVVYVLSANADYTRSTAIFSSGMLNNVRKRTVYRTIDNGRTTIRYHEHYAEHPGKIALNLLTARQKTFVHEFAHAMSHFNNGAIVDEYFNELKLIDSVKTSGASVLDQAILRDLRNFKRYSSPIHMINKRPKNKTVDPVPKIFRQYNAIKYWSDRDHPSAEEDWIYYFPLREALQIGCTMDRTIGQHKFDKLLSDFMYDRLMAKINRK